LPFGNLAAQDLPVRNPAARITAARSAWPFDPLGGVLPRWVGLLSADLLALTVLLSVVVFRQLCCAHRSASVHPRGIVSTSPLDANSCDGRASRRGIPAARGRWSHSH
jgi:hypothetical protein